jgi:hypothetical protein
MRVLEKRLRRLEVGLLAPITTAESQRVSERRRRKQPGWDYPSRRTFPHPRFVPVCPLAK